MTLINLIKQHDHLTLKDLALAILDRDDVIRSLLKLLDELIGPDAAKYEAYQRGLDMLRKE
jgi:hypothetical protein